MPKKTYIGFEYAPISPRRVTQVWGVVSLSSRALLGEVRWHAPWRRYCFFPATETIWSPDCLEDVVTWCKKQTEMRKKEREEAKSG